MKSSADYEVTVEQEVLAVFERKPHVVLLGAGATSAALPDGDKNGVAVPLLREVAAALDLAKLFPDDLRDQAEANFEAAYSQLFDRDSQLTEHVNKEVHKFFTRLELPEEPNLYDALLLSLGEKDAIFTFNWDPFLLQSRIRLARAGVGRSLPQVFFLHGNVLAGFCNKDANSGLISQRCSYCGEFFEPSPLLLPVEKKNYQDGALVEREWRAVRDFLKHCFMLTIFGYSAPTTDIEAIGLLKEGWGEVSGRNMEQTEIINRPGADPDELRERWKSFIHTHHYEIHDSFYDSWLANHPRRSGEAYRHQYWEARFTNNNPIPQNFQDLGSLIDWFAPLLGAEDAVLS